MVNEIEKSRAYDSQSCDEIRSRHNEIEKELVNERKNSQKMKTECESLLTDYTRLNEEVLDLQSRSMRDNLLFFGIPECSTFDQRKEEDCLNKIQMFCENSLKIENVDAIKIDRAHRIGNFNSNKTRPIVVKFNYFPDKLRVKRAAYENLKDTDFRVKDQYPKQIAERRKVLFPVMQKARSEGKRVTLSYDKLYVNGETITVDSVRARDTD